VLAQLKMENIEIDSLDSILPFGTPCLSEYAPCCLLDTESDTMVDLIPESGDQCKVAFDDLKLSDDCQVGSPRTMFKMLSNADYS